MDEAGRFWKECREGWDFVSTPGEAQDVWRDVGDHVYGLGSSQVFVSRWEHERGCIPARDVDKRENRR